MKKKNSKNNKKIKKISILKKIKNFYSSNLIYLISSIFIILIIFVYLIFFRSSVKENTLFEIEKGSSISSVSKSLKEKNLIYSEKLFKTFVYLFGNSIKSGTYELKKGYSTPRISKIISEGSISMILITFPEGITIKQAKNILLKNDNLQGSLDCNKENTDICNLQDGDIFPDTYKVPLGESRSLVLSMAKKKMDNIYSSLKNSNYKLPRPLKSLKEVIILASIVQKETPIKKEMPIVASVYLNRLKKRMKLQADPTVVYHLTDKLGNMEGKPLFLGHLKIKNPYNTYVVFGLPPTPIANVGSDAIKAVLNPADTNYLFFVADGNGGHKFARTYLEHKKNQNIWREIKKIRNSTNNNNEILK